MQTTRDLGLELLEDLIYSPDLSLLDYFSPTENPKVWKFSLKETVLEAVVAWSAEQQRKV